MAKVARDYFAGFFTERLLEANQEGEVIAASMYYDPNIDHSQNNALIGLGIAWYLVPYDRELAYRLYSSAAQFLGLRDEEYAIKVRAQMIAMTITMHQLALVLAIEFGDRTVQSNIQGAIDVLAEPRYFGDGEFGFFYNLGEPWPRGQLSALLMVAEVGAKGSWHRLFNNKGFRSRFSAPAIEGVDFPNLGIASAWNEPKTAALLVTTYAATPSAKGTATSFNVVRAPAAMSQSIKVLRDGQAFENWNYLDGGKVEIHTSVEEHTFIIYTGYTGPTGVDNFYSKL